MKLLAWVVWIFSALTCYGQIDVFYTGRMLGHFRFPDQQDFDMGQCPASESEMNDTP